MELRVQLVAIVAAVGLLLFVLELVRRRRLLERYALLWLFSGLSLLVLAVWKGLLQIVADAIGIFYPPSALFVIAFGFILVLLLHFSLAVSRLADQNRMLAQRLALVEQRMRRRERIPGVAHEDATVTADVVEQPAPRS
ncbi:MAG: hypothetical protein QOE69_1164 [Thermoleophilaceae bacterium]|jgi:hypothetical protein|nr:hypothetical protein [Thermoleophilaceae bacterium]MEA2407045.1 hypothetical protein [Thermoleophilaceae bacterium]